MGIELKELKTNLSNLTSTFNTENNTLTKFNNSNDLRFMSKDEILDIKKEFINREIQVNTKEFKQQIPWYITDEVNNIKHKPINKIPIKKFVIGLPNQLQDATAEENENFIIKNKEVIEACYIHPPFGGLYVDYKPTIDFSFTPQTIENTRIQCEMLKKYNIPIQVTFNNRVLHRNITDTVLYEDIKKYIDLFGTPDYILTYDKFAEGIKNKFPNIKLARTVNENNFTSIKNTNLQFFDIVVFNNNLYNIELFQALKEKYNTKIEMMFLTKCVSHCPGQGGEPCDLMFEKLSDKFGINYEIAQQMILPEELILFDKYMDFIKYGSIGLNALQWSMEKYTTKNDFYTKDFLNLQMQGIYTQHCFNPHTKAYMDSLNYKLDLKNYNEIIEIKNKIWTEKLGKPINIEDL